MTVQQPDPTLVAEAVAAAATWTGGDPDAAWRVADSRVLKNSSIHFIDLDGADAPTRLVYKTKTSSSGRQWFEENPTLTNVAVGLLNAEGLRGTPVLAVDPDRLIVVTLFVPGAPLQPLGWSNGRLGEKQRHTYTLIGRGAAVLESVTDPIADIEVTQRLWSDFEERLRSAGLGPALEGDVAAVARASFDAATADPAHLFMGHSDLTFGNVVVDDGVPALIDISFARSLRGGAVAKLIHRLEFTPQVMSPAAKEAIAAVREGYGAEPAGMPFLRAHRLVRLLDSPGGRFGSVSVRRRRAISALTGAK